MKAQRPYLFNAIYSWLTDSGCTPFLLVDAEQGGVFVPVDLVKDGKIVLNVGLSAIVNYTQDDNGISFSARFSGKSENIVVPFSAMIALYAKENTLGMVFPPEVYIEEEQEKIELAEAIVVETDSVGVEESNAKPAAEKPTLKIVK
jgi:stringent starvation protein B